MSQVTGLSHGYATTCPKTQGFSTSKKRLFFLSSPLFCSLQGPHLPTKYFTHFRLQESPRGRPAEELFLIGSGFPSPAGSLPAPSLVTCRNQGTTLSSYHSSHKVGKAALSDSASAPHSWVTGSPHSVQVLRMILTEVTGLLSS